MGASLLGLVFGSFSQMPPEATAAVRQTDRLMQKALRAPTAGEVPSAVTRVPDFRARTVPHYQLDQRPVPFSAQRLVEVRVYFTNGLVVSCLYAPRATPVCEEAKS